MKHLACKYSTCPCLQQRCGVFWVFYSVFSLNLYSIYQYIYKELCTDVTELTLLALQLLWVPKELLQEQKEMSEICMINCCRCCMQSQSCTRTKVGHQIWVAKAKCAPRQAPIPTCVDAALQPHALEVVVASLLVLLKRAALFITPPTVGTLVGFSNCRNPHKNKHKQSR